MKPTIDDIIGKYKQSIFKICFGYSNSMQDAEDLLQDVFINIWKGLPSFKKDANIKTWIFRIAVNTCLLKLRKKAIQTVPIDSFENTFLLDRTRRNLNPNIHKLHEFIQQLPKQEKAIILLYLEGLSHKEISAVIGITSNYVGVKINRIKQHLSTKFKNNG